VGFLQFKTNPRHESPILLCWLQAGSQGQLRLHPLIGYVDKLIAQVGKLERTLGIGALNRAALGLTAASAMSLQAMNDQVRELTSATDPDIIEIMQEFSE
jgi:hypothetical protein